MNINKAYTFNDVLIQPKYSEVLSRSNGDTATKLGNIALNLPIISANMRTITESSMARAIAKHGGLGILHRFNTIEENVKLYKQSIEPIVNFFTGEETVYQIGVSIGVQESDKKRFVQLYEAGARIFCIDVAHGHHILVKNMLSWIENEIFLWDRHKRSQLTLIAGNIASPDAYFDLAEWGADVIKCGIGSGSRCTSRQIAGVGYPQLSLLEEIHKQKLRQIKHPAIISDGGIKHVGDIAKALKFADAVMIGGMIAGTTETPGNVYKGHDGSFYKVYGGSASGENKGTNKFVEGMTKTVPFNGKVKYILKEIKEGLQSSLSYVGANNLEEFKKNCEFVHISSESSYESKF